MINFPAIWVWYGFLGLCGILLLIAGIQLVTSLRYGSRLPLNILVSAIFLVGISAIMITTFTMLSSVDWSTTYSIAVPSTSFLRFGN